MTLFRSGCVFAIVFLLVLVAGSDTGSAHLWHRHPREAHNAVQRQSPPPVASRFLLMANAEPMQSATSMIAKAFKPFVDLKAISCRSEDAFLIGELADYGGHCGRADDYHYHISTVHVEKQGGKSMPIAYPLDGYPIYGYSEHDGSPVKGLD